MHYRFSSTKGGYKAKNILIGIALAAVCAASALAYRSTNRFIAFSGESAYAVNEGGMLRMDIGLRNLGASPFSSEEGYFLSGKLLSGESQILELPRADINLSIGEVGNFVIVASLPVNKGSYQIVIDVVKEGEFWLEGKGNRPLYAELRVE